MERELNNEGARHIEFQRVHRIGAKKPGNSRSIIAHFVKYPNRERVFKRALERRAHIDVKIYSDLPREIQESRKKQWPLLKRAREGGRKDSLFQQERTGQTLYRRTLKGKIVQISDMLYDVSEWITFVLLTPQPLL